MFLNAHKQAQFQSILDMLNIKNPNLDLVSEIKAVEIVREGRSALGFLCERIGKRLEVEFPKVSKENNTLFVEYLPLVRALELFLAYFGDYLEEGRLKFLSHCVSIHAQNTIKNAKELLEQKDFVGVTIIGLTQDNKHIDDVDLVLKNLGLEVIYFCNTLESYENAKGKINNSPCICAYPIYFAPLSNARVIISTNGPLPIRAENNKSVIISLDHVFNSALRYTLWRTDWSFVFASLKRERIDRCDIVAAHTKSDAALLKKVFEYYKLPKKQILELGNLSLDWALKQLETKKADLKEQYLLIAPSYLVQFLEVKENLDLIGELLEKGIYVALRAHPLMRDYKHKKEVQERLDYYLKNYKNFAIDLGDEYFSKYLINSFALISDESSMGVSYPYLMLKPAIIFAQEERRVGITIDGISLYEKGVNLMCKNADEMREAVEYVLKNAEKITEEIKLIRDAQSFNIKNSSKVLAQEVLRILKGENHGN